MSLIVDINTDVGKAVSTFKMIIEFKCGHYTQNKRFGFFIYPMAELGNRVTLTLHVTFES